MADNRARQRTDDAAATAQQNQVAAGERASDTWGANHSEEFKDAAVRLNGEIVIRFHAADSGQTLDERAKAVQERLNTLTAGSDYTSLHSGTQVSVAALSIVTVVAIDGEPVIFFNGHRLVTVTRADAKANGSNSPFGLASDWATALREGAMATHVRGAERRFEAQTASQPSSDSHV
jgi:hypothetical protein